MYFLSRMTMSWRGQNGGSSIDRLLHSGPLPSGDLVGLQEQIRGHGRVPVGPRERRGRGLEGDPKGLELEPRRDGPRSSPEDFDYEGAPHSGQTTLCLCQGANASGIRTVLRLELNEKSFSSLGCFAGFGTSRGDR